MSAARRARVLKVNFVLNERDCGFVVDCKCLGGCFCLSVLGAEKGVEVVVVLLDSPSFES